MSFMSAEQIKQMGFAYVGKDVKISSKASFYGAEFISIGDYARIDDFCVISASPKGIHIGKYVHIAVFCCLMGQEHIELRDFSGLSSRVSIYSSSDNYNGIHLTNPCVPLQYREVKSSPVVIYDHTVVGASTVILPGVFLGKGCAVGAHSLVKKSFLDFTIIGGVPADYIGIRDPNVISLGQQLLDNEAQ